MTLWHNKSLSYIIYYSKSKFFVFHYRAFALKSKVVAGVSSFNSYEWYDQV